MLKENQKMPQSDGTPIVSLKIFYAKGEKLTLKGHSFKGAMEMVWNSGQFSIYEPLKIVFTSTGKTLYADKEAFIHFLHGNFNLEALIQHTQCDELYRNTRDFKADESNTVVESGSLWKLQGEKLTLIDNDHYVETRLSSFFEIAD